MLSIRRVGGAAAGIVIALDELKHHRADTLVVAKLDRLSRSLLDFAGLMDRAAHERWALIALDLGVDSTSPAGEMMANVMATFAQFERRLISERTKAALAVRQAQGVYVGRPRSLPRTTLERILREREAGASYQAIADRLTDEGVPTAHGGRRWYVSTVRRVLESLTRHPLP